MVIKKKKKYPMMSTNDDRLFLSFPLSRTAFCSIRKAVLLAALAFVYSASDAERERGKEKRREKNKEKESDGDAPTTPFSPPRSIYSTRCVSGPVVA